MHLVLLWMSEIVLSPNLPDPCCAGPPLHLLRTTLPPDIAPHRLFIVSQAPWKSNFCAALPLHAAILSWMPAVVPLFGFSMHWPVELLLNSPRIELGLAPP